MKNDITICVGVFMIHSDIFFTNQFLVYGIISIHTSK